MSDASKYGQCFWAVVTEDTVFAVFADRVRIDAGALILESQDKDDPRVWHVRLARAPGQWEQVAASSVIDGNLVAVDHSVDRRPKARSRLANKRE